MEKTENDVRTKEELSKGSRLSNENRLDKKDFLISVFLFIIPFAFFLPILLKNVNINIGDGIGYEIIQYFFKKTISEGELPLWNKYVALGTSFVGDIQNKVFYPFTWICSIFPERLAFKIFYVLHIALADAFMYFFCRQIKCSKGVSVFGAFVFSFSNLIIIRYEHINILCCLIWIPIIFVFLLRYFENYKKSNLIFTAIFMSMQFMAGFPQTAFYSDLFVFTALLYLNCKHKHKPKAFFSQAIIIGVTYVGLCAIQILPLVEIMQFSGRSEISYEYFSDGAANILQIFNLAVPNATGDFANLLPGSHEFPTDPYLGIIPLTLIIFAWRYMYKNKDVIFLSFYALLALIFSCACSNFPMLGKIIYMLPVFGSFRTTTRMLAFFVIPLIVISILALQHIWEQGLWKNYLIVSLGTLLCMLVIYTCIQIIGINSESPALQYYTKNSVGIKSIILLMALCVFILVLYKTKGSGRFAFFITLTAVVFQVFDVYFFNIDTSTSTWRLPKLISARTYEDVFDSDVKDVLVSEMQDESARYFISFYTWEELADTTWALRPNGNMLSNLPMIQSYITFNNPNLLEMANTTYGMMMNADQLLIGENQSLINMLNVGYVVSKKNQQPLGEYSYAGVIYEEYLGRQLEKNAEISLGDVDADSYITISIDAEIQGSGSTITMYSGDQILDVIGSFSPENKFYGYNYVISENVDDLRFVVDKGENVKINGIRFEKYQLEDMGAFEKVFKDDDYTVYKNRDSAGHVMIFKNVESVDGAFDYVKNNKASIQFTETAFLDKADKDIKIINCRGNVDDTKEKINSVTARVTIDSEQALVGFSESYYPGWHVYVDGKEAELLEVDGLIQGVLVTNGTHEVVFRYSPESVKMGAVITGISILLVILFLVVDREKYMENQTCF